MVRQRLLWQFRRLCWSSDRLRLNSPRPGSAPPLVAPAPALVPSGAPALATAPGLTPSRAPAAAPAAGGTKSAAKCDNPNALGVSRTVEIDTTGGPGFGFEHFKQHRLPARPRSGADLRRRPVADHAGRAQGARRRMRQGDLLPDRQARHLLSGNSPAGRGGRSHASARTPGRTRICRPSRSPDEAKAEIEKGRQRREMGARGSGSGGAVLPLPGAAPSAGDRHLSRRRATSRSSRPTWTRSTSRCASPSRS